jgi:hypothetical protein
MQPNNVYLYFYSLSRCSSHERVNRLPRIGRWSTNSNHSVTRIRDKLDPTCSFLHQIARCGNESGRPALDIGRIGPIFGRLRLRAAIVVSKSPGLSELIGP